MDISVDFRTYNGFGGQVTLSLVGGYLCHDAPSFGGAVAEIEILAHVRPDGPPRRTLERMFEDFHVDLAKLPKITFRRRSRKIELGFLSESFRESDLDARESSPEIFRSACIEVVNVLQLLGKRIRKDDDFDTAAFQAWLEQRVEQLPSSLAEFSEIRSAIDRRRIAERANLSDWDKLAIDFAEFHSDARSIVDTPALWDVCDDFSPNGNDTGADVLERYRTWRRRSPRTRSTTFLANLLQEWGVDTTPDTRDPFSIETYHQAVVGLAFAELKLRATCPRDVAQLALGAHERREVMPNPLHWDTAIAQAHHKSIASARAILERFAE